LIAKLHKKKRFTINLLKNNSYILSYKVLDKELSLFQLGYVSHRIANHNYQKEDYTLFERIYQNDTPKSDISEDKISLKNKTGPILNNRTFIKVLIFTESNTYLCGKKTKYKYFWKIF
jgi:hypothetical protein